MSTTSTPTSTPDSLCRPQIVRLAAAARSYFGPKEAILRIGGIKWTSPLPISGGDADYFNRIMETFVKENRPQ